MQYAFTSRAGVRKAWRSELKECVASSVKENSVSFQMVRASLTNYPLFADKASYLPGAGETVIKKAVPPGRGLCIALRMG